MIVLDLDEAETMLLFQLVNQRIVSLNKPETPLETGIMEKIVNARNNPIKNGAS